jgi:hypothetical protein
MRVKWDGVDLDYAFVPDIASTVELGIAVDPFPISFLPGNADAIIITGDGSEVENAHYMLVFGLPQVRNNAVLEILAIDPGESLGKVIPFPEGRSLEVKLSKIFEESFKTLAHRISLQGPI